MYNYTKRYNKFSTDAMASKLQVLLRLADESDDELVNAHFRSGKWKYHKDAQHVTMRLCNVSTGRVLELIATAICRAGRAGAQDSGMSCVFAGYSSKKRDGW